MWFKKLEDKAKKLIGLVGIVMVLLTGTTAITASLVKIYKQVRENRGLTEVLLSALIADFKPIDSLDYIVKLDEHEIKVRLRKVTGCENVYVFVLNNNLMMYFASWDDSDKQWFYIDFSGEKHIIEIKK